MSLPPQRPGPLHNAAFRALWIASIFSYVGTWVQDVAASWLMLSLTKSPLVVAMLTTSITVPAFVSMLPAGVLADRLDRRRILIVAQAWMAVVALALAVLTGMGLVSPLILLLASAGLGVGSALSSPPWQTLVPELVPRTETAEAVTLSSLSFNIARAVGPALGGIVLGAMGAATAFALNAVSFLAVIEVLRRHDTIRVASARRPDARQPERLREAIRTAFLTVHRSPPLRAAYASVFAFGLAASAVTALLPVFAKHDLFADAKGYGAMLGALGAGAIAAALGLRRLRSLVEARTLVAGGMALYAVSMVGVSRLHSLAGVLALLALAGVGWLASLATLNALVQLTAPEAAKSRVMALYQVSFLTAWAVGSGIGGVIATRLGAAETMTIGAVCALGAAALSSRLALPAFSSETSGTQAPPLRRAA